MMPRLFTPYATTKEKGTGLGLAIVQRIVFEHGGDISYRKPMKGGAVFEIWLPSARTGRSSAGSSRCRRSQRQA
jgi:two-component system nitrogen regulation sensor histidine kinase NtrY